MVENGRTGRRAGPSDTREAILRSARELFAARGYAGASLREIAAGAGVDVALIRYFHGTKADLLSAVLALPPQVPERLLAALDGDPGGLGERLTRAYLRLWEDPDTGPQVGALFRAAVTSPEAAELLRAFLGQRLVAAIAPRLPGERREDRVTLASSQLIGIAIARHVIALEPLASMPREEVVAAVGPVVQGHLLPDAGADPR